MSSFEAAIESLTLTDLPRLTPKRIGTLHQDELFVLLSKFEHALSPEQTAVAKEAVEALLSNEDDEDDEDDGFVVDARTDPSTPRESQTFFSGGGGERRRRNSLNEAVARGHPMKCGFSEITASSQLGGGTKPLAASSFDDNNDKQPSVMPAASIVTNSGDSSESPTVESFRTFATTTEDDTGSEAVPGDDMSSFTTAGGTAANPTSGDTACFSPTSRRFSRAGEFANAPRRATASVDNLDQECTAKRRAKAADDAREFARALKWIFEVLEIDELPVDVESRPEECFGDQLKDGVLLCKLANKMKPGLIQKITKHSSIPFHQMANITSFLRGCQSLGVKRRDCFDTVDLQQLKDLSKVYETLLALSRAVQHDKSSAFHGPFLYSSKREERLLRQQKSSSSVLNVMGGSSSSSSSSSRGPSIAAASTAASNNVGPPSTRTHHRLPVSSFPPGTAASVSSSSDADNMPPLHLGRERTSSLGGVVSHQSTLDDDAASDAGSVMTTFSLPPSASECGDNAFQKVASLSDFVRRLSLEKYSAALAEVADDLNDLREMTDDDLDSFVQSSKMSTLKARRFKKALIELGAKLKA